MFGIPRGIFGIPRSMFGIPRSIFGIPRSHFGIPKHYIGHRTYNKNAFGGPILMTLSTGNNTSVEESINRYLDTSIISQPRPYGKESQPWSQVEPYGALRARRVTGYYLRSIAYISVAIVAQVQRSTFDKSYLLAPC